jgi:hypothetical protein
VISAGAVHAMNAGPAAVVRAVAARGVGRSAVSAVDTYATSSRSVGDIAVTLRR